MGRVAARIVSHTTDRHRHKIYQLSRQCAKFTWHNGRYARATGGTDACTFERGGAESTTFDLKIDDQQRIPNGVIHVSYNTKNAQQRVSVL